MVLAVADRHTFPTVTELGTYVQAKNTNAESNAIVVSRNDQNYNVPTFRDSACRQPTTSISDRVQCVGSAQAE